MKEVEEAACLGESGTSRSGFDSRLTQPSSEKAWWPCREVKRGVTGDQGSKRWHQVSSEPDIRVRPLGLGNEARWATGQDTLGQR